MATGVAARCAADWGLATTGVAGPDPQDGHPVGEVYVAVAAARPQAASGSTRWRCTGDRDDDPDGSRRRGARSAAGRALGIALDAGLQAYGWDQT